MMIGALGRIRTIESPTRYVRRKINNVTVQEGSPIALLDGELVMAGRPCTERLVVEILHRAAAHRKAKLLRCIMAAMSPAAAQEMHARLMHEFPEQEIEVHEGGQPLYPYIISIE